jgi:hypothetical protein
MIGGDELNDFSLEGDYVYFDAVVMDDAEEELFDDGVESDVVSPCLFDTVTAPDGIPLNESRQR